MGQTVVIVYIVCLCSCCTDIRRTCVLLAEEEVVNQFMDKNGALANGKSKVEAEGSRPQRALAIRKCHLNLRLIFAQTIF